ncbi:restriction endonuclease subunit S [Virgibacillus halodenitrificans]|uniref:restriction endonuclease subunit S n=1 Tax=Virgibacillus halodenitrificans TaxID=1482 RepID=UPI001F43E978|nr:restriction endonuclease subunit S [Virgibacillus halodenitrificans]
MEQWKTYEFKKIVNLSKEKYNPKKENTNLPCIELEHIESETGRLLGYANSIEQQSIKNRFKPSNVLYGKLRPYLKKYFFSNFEGVCTSEIWVLDSVKGRIENKFLFYLIQTNRFNENANKSSGTKMPRADWNYVSNLIFTIPPIKEQQKIASILYTWDNAIDLKEKLIEQKKEQKKGLMEKLLTGKVRLSGFEGIWQEVKLGTVFKERKETGYEHLELLAITSQKGVVKRTEVDIKDNSSADKSKYKRILPNDIGYNTMRMWQGVSGVSKYEGIVSPAYTILQPSDKVDSNFMGYLFKLPQVVNLFKRYSQGLVSDTLNLKYENLKNIKVPIPLDVKEQQSVSNVLMCIDKEIELLVKEIETIKLQKKGLIQLLLTGKVRVKV